MPVPYAGLPTPSPPAPPTLVVSRDRALVDVLDRLAAAAGAELDVHSDLPGRSVWLAAGLVLVGSDLAAEVAGSLPRRAGVAMVGLAPTGVLATRDDDLIWRQAVDVGAERVAVLPASQEWVVQALAQALDGPRRCAVVGVVGGSGGAGASALATAVAVVAAGRGRRTLLADLDPLGGGLDLLLGAERVSGLRWPELSRARGRISGGMLREALPRVDGLSVLSWDRGAPVIVPSEAAAAVAEGAARGFDLVVADLARCPASVPAGWLRRIDLALVVVVPTVRALAAATRVVAGLDGAVDDVRAVVRGPGAGPVPAEVVAESLGRSLFAQLRSEPGLARALERGEPPGLRPRGPLARCAGRILQAAAGLELAA
jgi:secretion/DNA translocation related CpaE-like protein